MYLKAIIILVAISALLAGLWKLYDAGGDAREAEVRLEFESERAEMFEQITKARSKAENQIFEDRIVYRDRIQKIREVVNTCDLPADLVQLLRESGVFSG